MFCTTSFWCVIYEAGSTMKLYEKYANEIERGIEGGIIRAGDRIPSVRDASLNRNLSPGTIQKAYRLLEDKGLIYTRPRSGYYASANWKELPPRPNTSSPSGRATSVEVHELAFHLMETTKVHGTVRFGSVFPGPELFPLAKLARALYTSALRMNPDSVYDTLPPGNPELRRLIGRQYLGLACNLKFNEIVITSGALEALNLCLQAVTRRGDLIAIESPTFFAALEAIERLGLKAVEIATCPNEGMDLSALATALARHPIKACYIMTNFQHPLGSLMPDNKKQALVRLLASYDIPLIEDDVYAELYFGRDRPKSAKSFDNKGLVMHCSSFSKCLAPGYRVGWTAAGRFAETIARAKYMSTIATSAPMQTAIVEFLKYSGYQHHLRKLRLELQSLQNRMLHDICRKFPKDIRVTRPGGGYFLWIEMPQSVNALEVHRRAMEDGISVAPGQLFSPKRKFKNFIRLNYGQARTPQTEAAISKLGGIISALS